MTDNPTLEAILDFAIQREQEAVEFYTSLAANAKRPAMKEVFEQFAREEEGHKSRLMGVKSGRRDIGSPTPIPDLKLGDYLVAEEPGPEITYQDALILAMKKEKAAFKLYTDLAAQVGDPEVRDLLLAIAQEEAKHKLRFETEYDDVVMSEN